MSCIKIVKRGITKMKVDAVVNAANSELKNGGGVAGAVFSAAGEAQLSAACNAIGGCKTGHAVITPGFELPAKYIIHAVGPIWRGGDYSEAKLLYSAYKQSLIVAKDNDLHSIAFPLISAGIYGYPQDKAWRKALQACRDFIEANPDYDIDISFAVIDDDVLRLGESVMKDLGINTTKQSNVIEILPDEKKSINTDRLSINGKMVDAIFFHKPEEPYGWLSNWYRSDFELDGINYSSVEQCIMYQKCVLFGDTESAHKVMETVYPDAQQAIARNATGYIDCVWRGYRQIIVEKALMAKFSQNRDLKQKLLDTGDAWLVECARTDKNWACGISLYDDQRFDASNWLGMNILGFALMKVREDIQNNKENRK